ncbi:nucleoside phosphatase family-domain-containing protein [Paraphoma chrysanthemicola]|uniref:Nucleoside phosphatase family-domain-containing protein n=1 Tax=Paraphoma chrysanthemicola TaxID=798071 RepID=A0A8K0RAP1_9PLEO|nr:nucleoside phosphatase family-domain-containing protein [Paraphoma chrysanthemicola]
MGKWRYGVVLDAGSSGTRVHIYRWLNTKKAKEKASQAQLHSLPVIETDKKWTKKIHPGISTFGEHPHDVGPEHLDKLLSHALSKIPHKDVPNTPLFLLATAGMRILPNLQRESILKEVCDFARSTTKFQLPDCDLHVQVIPGETEGLYGWIAANYLLGGFDRPEDHDHGKGHSTYGFLDMGGASAQIAFAPNATEAEKHANDLTLLRLRTIDGTSLEYKVFVTTWLGFGANQARQRYVKALMDSTSSKELPDPCLPAGLKIEVTKDGTFIESDPDDDDDKPPSKGVAHLLGTGKFSECLHQTYPLLEKEKECKDAPCLINGQHVPALDFDVNHFVGVSEYWHTTHEIFEMGYKDKAYDFKTYQERVEKFCNEDWKKIAKGLKKEKWGSKVDEEKAREVCFKASWIINMLHDGIGVPRVGIEGLPDGKNASKAIVDHAKEKGFLDPFQAVNKINDIEVSWTLGKMVLYASSEVPLPAENALAVGFGSNEPGIPKDFQYAGDTIHPYESDSDWHRLFVEHPQKIPAFFMMIFIVFFIVGIVIGKERRAVAKKFIMKPFTAKQGKDPLHRRKERSFVGKLLGLGRTQSYERVDLENPDAANDFELEETYLDSSDNENSDSSDGSRFGKTSGCATPQKDRPSYFGGAGASGGVLSQGAGLGLGPNSAFDRGGLLSRIDSRERIRSRANSPKRREGRSKLDE